MVEMHVLNRLRALAEHRRWLLGLAPTARCGWLTVALVAVEGGGLSSRVESVAHRRVRLPTELAQAYRRLRAGRRNRPGDTALLAARLAESSAALLDDFAAEVAPVWQRLSAVALHGPGLWRRADGLIGYSGLCDAARLADQTGLNVIDGFPDRDLAQDGRGRPLLPVPLWLLLHDLRRPRVVVAGGRRLRLTYLPPSRDASGASRTQSMQLAADPVSCDQARAEAIVEAVGEHLSQQPYAGELVWCDRRSRQGVIEAMGAMLPDVRVVAPEDLGVAAAALNASAVAVLGLLHLDQVPGNLGTATGARTPRVLGRLTPGSVVNWHRLVRELAARRPSAISLRSAM